MAKGQSGRVVIELDPSLKRTLHSALAANGVTLKDWFIDQANLYLSAGETGKTKKAGKQ